MRVLTEARRILAERSLNPEGQDLDRQRLGRTNLLVVKAAIDRQVNATVGRQSGERHEFTRPDLEAIEQDFVRIVERALEETFNAAH